MAYISSNANRWYCARETTYGEMSAITADHRIPAVSMTAQHQRESSNRRDKTGSRTWAGVPRGMRRSTKFELKSYMRDWTNQQALPAHGPLVEAALGEAGRLWPGGTPTTGTTESGIVFAADHGLNPGSAIVSNGEIRFVAAVADPRTVVMNAPYSTAPVVGVQLGSSANYGLASELPSVTLYDYWDPSTAVQRVLTGAGVDRMGVKLNGDFHEFSFSGVAQDLVDGATFISGQNGATTFPAEPQSSGNAYSPVPGNLGQVWIGVVPGQLFTVSSATIEVRNNLEARNREYGRSLPSGLTPGQREVIVSLELFAQDDDLTKGLYQAARQQDPVGLMFQLGQSATELAGIYIKSMIPDVPTFDDSEKRLKWKFKESRAQGTSDDEIVVAFG